MVLPSAVSPTPADVAPEFEVSDAEGSRALHAIALHIENDLTLQMASDIECIFLYQHHQWTHAGIYFISLASPTISVGPIDYIPTVDELWEWYRRDDSYIVYQASWLGLNNVVSEGLLVLGHLTATAPQ